MKKLLRILAIGVAVVVVLAIVAVVAASILINPNDYKDGIVKVVRDKTGRSLELKGDIGLSLFPWLGLELGETRLGNAPGFGAKPMASVDKVDLKLKLLPLLRKQVEVDTVVLDGLTLNLARNKQGTSNWDDLLARTRTGEKQPAKTKPTAAAAPVAALTIGGIDIRRAQLHWVDAQSGSSAHIRNLSLQTSKLATAVPMDVKLGFDLETGKPVIRTPVTLRGQVRVDPDKQTLAVKGLQLSLLDMSVDASLNGQQIMSSPSLGGKLALRPTNLRNLLGKLGIPLNMQADALNKVSLNSDFRFSQKTGTASVDALTLQLDDSKLTGKASYTLGKVPSIRADIAVDSIDVDRYLPPSTGKKKEKTGKKTPVAIPVEPLRKLDLQGSFKLGSLKALGIRSTNISIPVSARGGLVQVGPSSAQLYGGRYAGSQTLDLRKGAPRITSNEKLSNVEVGGLLKDADIFDKFTGVGNVSSNITARGLDVDDILNSLNGNASASLKNGQVKDLNPYGIVYNTCAVFAKLKGEKVEFKKEFQKDYSYSNFSLSALAKNGQISTKNFEISGGGVTINGPILINLPKWTTKFNILTTTPKTPYCSLNKFPATYSGTIDRLDLKTILKNSATNAIDQAYKEEVQKKLKEEIQKRLGIQPKKTAPTTPDTQTEQPKKTPEEQLKEELRKRLGL